MKTKHRIWIKIRLEWCWSWVPWDKVNVAQSCLTLWDPMDYTVHGILQARILEWVAFPFSRGSSQSRDQTQVSRIAGRFFTSWATREAQPVPSPGGLPNPGVELGSPALQVDSLPAEPWRKPVVTLGVLLLTTYRTSLVVQWLLRIHH